MFPFIQYADQFTSLLENHPEYALVFYKSHHASHDTTNIHPDPDQDIQSAHVQSNAPEVDTVTAGNWQTSAAAGKSYNHITQPWPANEQCHSSLSSLMVHVEAEVIQPGLPHAVQTTSTVTVEIEEC